MVGKIKICYGSAVARSPVIPPASCSQVPVRQQSYCGGGTQVPLGLCFSSLTHLWLWFRNLHQGTHLRAFWCSLHLAASWPCAPGRGEGMGKARLVQALPSRTVGIHDLDCTGPCADWGPAQRKPPRCRGSLGHGNITHPQALGTMWPDPWAGARTISHQGPHLIQSLPHSTQPLSTLGMWASLLRNNWWTLTRLLEE